MNLLVLILSLLRNVFPLPAFKDRDAVLEWLHRLESHAADLITAIVAQFQATGRVAIPLPDGSELVLVESGQCMAIDPGAVKERLRAIPEDQWKRAVDHAGISGSAIDAEAWGDGKFLDMFMALLPYLIKFLPFFLGPQPTPEPPEPPEPPQPPVV